MSVSKLEGRWRGALHDTGDRRWFPGNASQFIFPILAISSSQIFVSSSISWFYDDTREDDRVTKQNRTEPIPKKRGCSVCESSQEAQRGIFTLCCRACSRDSFFICSFLRLAVSAVLSELALERTWAISSLALQNTSNVWNQQPFETLGLHSGRSLFKHLRTWLVSPLRGALVSDISAPPAWFWPDSPGHTSSEPPRSGGITQKTLSGAVVT